MAPGPPPALNPDRSAVRELLGREPRGAFDVVVRDPLGRPIVIRNAPLLDDGTPMPTRYWLVGRDEVAAVVGRSRVLGGAAYIATALTTPGVIEQTGAHHRIVFGEPFDPPPDVTARAAAVRDALAAAGIPTEVVADARVPLWEKLLYLAPFAGFTGAARLPIGPLWTHDDTRDLFIRACEEVRAVAHAEGVRVPADVPARVREYANALPPSTRSSLLTDLQHGKRIEVEALQGALVRRARGHGVAVPIMETLYAVLRNHAGGQRS